MLNSLIIYFTIDMISQKLKELLINKVKIKKSKMIKKNKWIWNDNFYYDLNFINNIYVSINLNKIMYYIFLL
jgi:hypothetical protein